MDRVAAITTILLQILSEKYVEGELLVSMEFLYDLAYLHIAFIFFEYANWTSNTKWTKAKGWVGRLLGFSGIFIFISTSTWRHSRWYSLFFCYLLWIPMGMWRQPLRQNGAGAVFFFFEYGIIAV